jgi:hypothetical protein
MARISAKILFKPAISDRADHLLKNAGDDADATGEAVKAGDDDLGALSSGKRDGFCT